MSVILIMFGYEFPMDYCFKCYRKNEDANGFKAEQLCAIIQLVI